MTLLAVRLKLVTPLIHSLTLYQLSHCTPHSIIIIIEFIKLFAKKLIAILMYYLLSLARFNMTADVLLNLWITVDVIMWMRQEGPMDDLRNSTCICLLSSSS